MSETEDRGEFWGVIDLFGHMRIAGKIGEQTLGGDSFVRVDVPQVGEILAHTRLFGNKAIYSISVTTEEIARAVAMKLRSTPLTVFDFDNETRKRLAALPAPGSRNHVEDDEHEGYAIDDEDL